VSVSFSWIATDVVAALVGALLFVAIVGFVMLGRGEDTNQ
jgi:hypothetical protein